MCPKVRSLFQREAQSCAWRIELSETVKRATDSLRWGQSQLTYLEEKGTEEEKKKDLEKLRGKVAKWTETLKNAKERLAKVRLLRPNSITHRSSRDGVTRLDIDMWCLFSPPRWRASPRSSHFSSSCRCVFECRVSHFVHKSLDVGFTWVLCPAREHL